MKLFTCIKAVTLLAATGLAACTNPPAEQAGQAEKMGPSVVSYDHGALDTLVALGQQDRVLAVPRSGLPEYLAEVVSDLPDAGSLKVPDMDVLKSLQPELVLVTGRQGDAMDELKAIARVRNVGLGEGPYRESLEAKVMGLAELYAQEDLARDRLDELWRHVDQQRAELPDDVQVVVLTHNAGRLSLRRDPVVSELLGLEQPEVPDTVEPVTRGTRTFYPLTADDLAVMAPDVVLVVDRSAAIGAEPMDRKALEQSLAEAGAGSIRVRVLDPALWYLSGAGLESVRLQVDEVVTAVTSSGNRG